MNFLSLAVSVVGDVVATVVSAVSMNEGRTSVAVILTVSDRDKILFLVS